MDATLAPDLTPWEQRERLGVLRGFLQTLKGAALSPRTFFDRLRPETAWTEAFWYGWLVQAVFGALGALLAVVEMLPLRGDDRPRLGDLDWYLLVLVAPVALYPVLVLVLAAVVHLLALVTRETHRGLASTLRAVCYSGVALGLVVNLGPLAIWALVVGVYALARLQQMRPSRAAGALIGAELLLAAAVIVPLGVILARRLP